jgi:hypothetical protein
MKEHPKARQYLEECASFCPLCGDADEDNRAELRTYRPDPRQGERPALEVEWRCNVCLGRWTEVFRLSGVYWVERRSCVVGAGEIRADKDID